MVTRPPSTDDIRAYYEDVFLKFPTPSAAKTLGWSIKELDIEAKTLTVEFTANDEMLNPTGRVQGGFLGAMCDDTMGPLAHILTAGKMMPSSTDIHVQYHRPALPGKLICKAKITRMGRSLCYSEAELFNEKGQVVVKAIQTAMMLPFSTD